MNEKKFKTQSIIKNIILSNSLKKSGSFSGVCFPMIDNNKKAISTSHSKILSYNINFSSYNSNKSSKNNDINNAKFNNLSNTIKKGINSYNQKKNDSKLNPLMNRDKAEKLLVKLKNYYNEVKVINEEKSNTIEKLQNDADYEEFKYAQTLDFQDIELPDEKIIIKNFNELKLSKVEIEKQVRSLVAKKQEMEYLLRNVSEYQKTLEYMKEDEKTKIINILKEKNEIESRIYDVKKYQKIISDSLSKNNTKNTSLNELVNSINNDINIINEMIKFQKEKNEKLDERINLKEENIKILQENINSLKEQNNSEFFNYKKRILEGIQKAKEDEEDKKKREKQCCNIIFCLNIIQKYFINQEVFNKQLLENSQEFDAFMNDTFEICSKNISSNLMTPSVLRETISNANSKGSVSMIKENETRKRKSKSLHVALVKKINNIEENIDNMINNKDSTNHNNSGINNISSSSDRNNQKFNPNNSIQINKNNLNYTGRKSFLPSGKLGYKSFLGRRTKMLRTTSLVDKRVLYNLKRFSSNDIGFSNHNTICKTSRKKYGISLEELKEMFDEITLTEEQISDYYSKLASFIAFNLNSLKTIRKREIELEHKKQTYITKVKKIIQNDFDNFNEITKNNNKFKLFLEEYHEYIEKMKLKTELTNKKEIKKLLTNKVEDNDKDLEDIESASTKTGQSQVNLNAETLYKNCENLILDNTNFFESIIDIFEDVLKFKVGSNAVTYISNKRKLSSDSNKNDTKKSNLSRKNVKNKSNNDNYFDVNKSVIMKNDITKKDNNEETNEKNNFNKTGKNATNSENLMTDLDEKYKPYKDELDKLYKFEKINKKQIPNNIINLVEYIGKLIKFANEDSILNQIFNKDDLNEKLLNNFYKDGITAEINNTFSSQFISKEIPIKYDLLMHLEENKDEMINQLLSLLHFIRDNDNIIRKTSTSSLVYQYASLEQSVKKSMNSTKNNNFFNQEKSIVKKKLFTKKRANSKKFSKDWKTKKFNSTAKSSISVISDYTFNDDEESPEKSFYKSMKIIKNKDNPDRSSVDEKIVKKLYEPFLSKTTYLRKLNPNIKNIKNMIMKNSETNFLLNKKKIDIDNISKHMQIYENNKIKPNNLSDLTYNSLVQFINENKKNN